MATRVCFKCKEEKGLEEFYKHSQMTGSHLNKCKTCTCADVRKNRRDSPRAREYDRRRFHENPERRAYTIRRATERKAEHPEKYRCHYALTNAVRDGRIKKPDRCSRCNEKASRIEGHHDDYSKPLEVVWLCPLCHRRYYSG